MAYYYSIIKEGLIANKISNIWNLIVRLIIYYHLWIKKIKFYTILSNAKEDMRTNPIADLNCDDVASKLKILTSLCFNSFINNNIYVEGIKEIDKIDIDNAKNLGYKIKLLGFAELFNKKIYQRVHPTLIKKDTYVASIDGVLNAVIIDGKPVGQSIIQGEGAGPSATTSALVADISSILRGNIKFPFSLSNKERKKLKFENINERFFQLF